MPLRGITGVKFRICESQAYHIILILFVRTNGSLINARLSGTWMSIRFKSIMETVFRKKFLVSFFTLNQNS